jgi:hypothetical protein
VDDGDDPGIVAVHERGEDGSVWRAFGFFWVGDPGKIVGADDDGLERVARVAGWERAAGPAGDVWLRGHDDERGRAGVCERDGGDGERPEARLFAVDRLLDLDGEREVTLHAAQQEQQIEAPFRWHEETDFSGAELGVGERGQRELAVANERFEEGARIAAQEIEDFFVEERGHTPVFCRGCAVGKRLEKGRATGGEVAPGWRAMARGGFGWTGLGGGWYATERAWPGPSSPARSLARSRSSSRWMAPPDPRSHVGRTLADGLPPGETGGRKSARPPAVRAAERSPGGAGLGDEAPGREPVRSSASPRAWLASRWRADGDRVAVS